MHMVQSIHLEEKGDCHESYHCRVESSENTLRLVNIYNTSFE